MTVVVQEPSILRVNNGSSKTLQRNLVLADMPVTAYVTLRIDQPTVLYYRQLPS